MRKRKTGSLTEYVLLALEKSIDGYVRLEDFLSNPGYYAYAGGWQYPLKKSGLAQALKRLREDGLIEQVKLDDEKVILKLTDSGRDIVVSEVGEKDWDGRWRIVIFDIPEQKRLVRDLFRRNLKKWGFKHLQKSVWVSKKDVFEKLNSYIKDLGVEKWVFVIEADKLAGDHNM